MRPGLPVSPAPGPARVAGIFSSRGPYIPGAGIFRFLCYGHICFTCSEPIIGRAYRLATDVAYTHSHDQANCLAAAKAFLRLA